MKKNLLLLFFYIITLNILAKDSWFTEVQVTLHQQLTTTEGKILQQKEIFLVLPGLRLSPTEVILSTHLLPQPQIKIQKDKKHFIIQTIYFQWKIDQEIITEITPSSDKQFLFLTTSPQGEKLILADISSEISTNSEIFYTQLLPQECQPRIAYKATKLQTYLTMPRAGFLCEGTPGLPVFNKKNECLGILTAVPQKKEQKKGTSALKTLSLVMLIPIQQIHKQP